MYSRIAVGLSILNVELKASFYLRRHAHCRLCEAAAWLQGHGIIRGPVASFRAKWINARMFWMVD